MKKLIFILLVSCLALGQGVTPNLTMTLPPHGAPNWDVQMNGNFNILDNVVGILQLPFRGTWLSNVNYFKGQQVTFNNALYNSLTNFNLGNQPNTSPGNWVFVTTTSTAQQTFTETFTVGVGGVTQGQSVTTDTSGNAITVALGARGIGIAQATVVQGQPVSVAVEGTTSCLADNTVTAGDLLVAASTLAGRCLDSGQPATLQVNMTTPVIGKALSGGAAGTLVNVQLFGPGASGQSNIVSPNAEYVVSETGDQFGSLRFHVQNRTGMNGALVENPSISVTDMSLASTAAVTNISINGSNVLTVNAIFASGGSNLPQVGSNVSFSGLTTATFLNSQTVQILTVNATTFTANFTHAAYASAPDTGTATLQANFRAEFRASSLTSSLNTTGELQLLDPNGLAFGSTLKWFSAGKQTAAAPNNLVAGAIGTVNHWDRTPLITNGDFEIGTSNPPAGWIPGGNGTLVPTTISYETSTQDPGKIQSIKMTSSAAGSGMGNINVFQCVTGDSYAFQVDTKTDTGTSDAQLVVRDKNGAAVTVTGTSDVTSTSTSWVTLTGSFTITGANGYSCQLRIDNQSATTSSVWFDRIYAVKTNFPGPVVATSLTASGLTAGNCVQATTGGLLTTVGAACGTSSGTVTVTGTPASGQGTFFSGASSITGSTNWTYATGSGHSLLQGANGADAFFMNRFTDTSPTGNFLHFQNNAKNTDVFKVDVGGNITALGANDTGLSRIAANVIGAGNGTPTDASGDFRVGVLRVNAGTTTGIEIHGPTNGINMGSGNVVSWTATTSSVAADSGLFRQAAGSISTSAGGGTIGGAFVTPKLTDDGTGNFFRIQNVSAAEMALWNGGVFTWSSTSTAAGTKDTGLSRLAADSVACGNGAQGDVSCTFKATIANMVTGFQVNGAATTGNVLRGNGTNFVNATLAAADLSNGVTGSGAVVLATSPSISSPSTTGTDSGTETLNNKRVNPRAVAVADSTTITPNSDTSDIVTQTNTQAAGTLTIAAPTGSPVDGQKLIIRVKTTNAQTYSFNATYHFSTTVSAPTTTAATKTDYIGCMWNATNSAWDVVAVDQGH